MISYGEVLFITKGFYQPSGQYVTRLSPLSSIYLHVYYTKKGNIGTDAVFLYQVESESSFVPKGSTFCYEKKLLCCLKC